MIGCSSSVTSLPSAQSAHFEPRGTGQFGLSLVLRSKHRGQAAGSLGILAARNKRFAGSDIRRVFERVVEACIAAGLVGGEVFAVDASLIKIFTMRALLKLGSRHIIMLYSAS